jgi:signal transduction histidine kinase/CheY-like chemotaxis protein/ligand-binding sensor domain-containing protein
LLRSALRKVLTPSLAACALYVWASAVYAEDARFGPPMRRYSTHNGLPSDRILAIVQDRDDYVWIATERGLVRFDGAHFRAYDGVGGMPRGTAETLFVDSKNRLWVGLRDNGACALASSRKTAQCFRSNAIPEQRIPGATVYGFGEFNGEIVLAVFDAGLVALNAQTLAPIRFMPLEHADIVAAASDDTGAYFASFSGYVSVIRLENGVSTLTQNVLNANGALVSIALGQRVNNANKELWLGLSATQGVKAAPLPLGLGPLRDLPPLLGARTVFNIAQRSGEPVLATDLGLEMLHGSELQRMRAVGGAQDSLPEGRLTTLVTDSAGGLWIGSEASGVAYWPSPTLANESAVRWLRRGDGALPAQRVTGASGASDGVLWIALNERGVVAVFPDGLVERLGAQPNAPGRATPIDAAKTLPTEVTHAIYAQPPGNAPQRIWIGHQRGLSVYLPDTKQFLHQAGNGQTKLVDLLAPDGAGGMWLASGRANIMHVDAQLNALQTWDRAVTGGDLEQLSLRDDGLWLAGAAGLRHIARTELGRATPQISSVLSEPSFAFAPCAGALWVATAHSLVALGLDATHAVLARRPRPTAWPEDIGGMACSDSADSADSRPGREKSDSTLWFAGPGGLWRMDARPQAVESLPVQVPTGVTQVELNDRPFQTLDGRFLIASQAGLLSFDPTHNPGADSENSSDTQAPAAAAFSVRLIHEEQDAPVAVRLQLPWQNPTMTLQAQALSFAAPELTQFQFQLTPSGQHAAATAEFGASARLDLRNLAPGDYTLRVAARDAQGMLAHYPAVGAAAIQLAVIAPPWQRGYFWLTAMALALALVSAISVSVTRRRAQRRATRAAARAVERHATVHTEQLALARTETLGYISHEMRNLLNGVTGNAELLRLSLTDRAEPTITAGNPQLKFSQRMVQAGEALAQLLDDALDHTKLVVRKLTLAPAAFELDELLLEAIESQRAAAEAKQICLLHHFEGTEQRCHADAGRIRQIVVNLLSNAIKFTEAGQVLLHASVQSNSAVDSAQAAPRTLCVTVTDSGSGIDAPLQADIFKPYVRLNPAVRGSGLGLAISAELAQLLGGTLRLAHSDSNGSRFELVLPLESVASAHALDTAPNSYAPLHILIVEDELDNQLLLAELLQNVGHSVVVAADSFAALGACQAAFAAQHPFNVVLMDIDLGAMSGLDLAPILAVQPGMRGTPIVALSGRADSHDRAACHAAGMREHIAKPYRLALIQATMLRAVEQAG